MARKSLAVDAVRRTWPPEFRLQAQTEGWDLFAVDRDGDAWIEIERIDDPTALKGYNEAYNSAAPKFESDAEAVAYVARRALIEREPCALKALEIALAHAKHLARRLYRNVER